VVEAQSKSSSHASSHAADLFGFERTRALSLQPAAEIAEAARLFGQTDDITVVTVAYYGAGAAEAGAAAAVEIPGAVTTPTSESAHP
jgi:hypothetical protein